ncbi:MAG: tetratricopeptide repeat protein, partial [bacterium]|nr:tetratricopeptide repeat protein [bacterium]
MMKPIIIILGIIFVAASLFDIFHKNRANHKHRILHRVAQVVLILLGAFAFVYGLWPDESKDLAADSLIIIHDGQKATICTPEEYERRVAEMAALMADSMRQSEVEAYRESLAVCRNEYARIAEAPFELGVLAFSDVRYDDARRFFKETLSIPILSNEKRSEALFYLGLMDDLGGDHLQALVNYDLALQYAPTMCEALNDKGNCLNALGRYEEAIQSFDAVLKINPNDRDALNNKGVSLTKLGCYAEAISAFNASLDANPNFYAALLNKANTISALGRHEEALQMYD